jgi:two-component system cell cycle sensor histidine kinase/response regulator CckA
LLLNLCDWPIPIHLTNPLTGRTMIAKKILFVDDDVVIQKAFSKFLSEQGHEVVCAGDVLAAIAILKEFTPHIIFTDLIMPKINGDVLCRIIRNMPKLMGCYLVIVSAAVLELNYDFTQVGADACIAKGPMSLMKEHILREIDAAKGNGDAVRKKIIRGNETVYSRQITKELLSQNQHLKIILGSISEGLLEVRSNLVIYANDAAVALLEIPYEKLIGTYLPDLIDLSRGISCGGELSLQDSLFLNNVSPETIELNNKQIAVKVFPVHSERESEIWLFEDVTKTKRMESIVEAANFTQNLGYIFSGIRHEIGNPVNSIKMALSVLRKNLPHYDNTIIEQFVERCLLETSRIEYLLKALKNYSLFERPEVQRVRLEVFIQDFLALVRNDFADKGFEVDAVIEPGAIWGYVDSRALHQVLLNLLTNAVDAVAGEEEPRIAVHMHREDSWIKIRVKDNGCGIPEEDKKDLFKPFFTTKAHGTGLGLTIVQKMLSTMHCHIEIASRGEKGTTAIISIPAEK